MESYKKRKKNRIIFLKLFLSISILDSSPKLNGIPDAGPKLTGIPGAGPKLTGIPVVEGGGDDTLIHVQEASFILLCFTSNLHSPNKCNFI